MNSYSSQVTQEEPRNSMPAGAHRTHSVQLYGPSRGSKDSFSSRITEEELNNSLGAEALPAGHIVSFYSFSKWLRR